MAISKSAATKIAQLDSQTKKTKSVLRKPRIKAVLPKQKCKGCFLEFIPADKRQKFHSPKCRDRYYELTVFKKKMYTKECKYCGKHFETSCPSKQSYCNETCRTSYQREHPCPSQVYRNPEKYQNSDITLSNSTSAASTYSCSICGKTELNGASLIILEGKVLCKTCAAVN